MDRVSRLTRTRMPSTPVPRADNARHAWPRRCISQRADHVCTKDQKGPNRQPAEPPIGPWGSVREVLMRTGAGRRSLGIAQDLNATSPRTRVSKANGDKNHLRSNMGVERS